MHLGRGAARVATDAIVRGARDFPRKIDDLDAATLSRIMNRPVASVTRIGGTNGTTSRALLALTGDGVPPTVFVKMAADTVPNRLIGELGRLAETEVRFYAELAGELTGIPRLYGSAFDSPTGRFVIVLEDLTAGDCEFPDTVHPLTPERAAQLVDLLAHLHGTFWGRLPDVGNARVPLGWLHAGSADPSVPLVGSMMRRSVRRLSGHTGIAVEAGRFIIDNYPAVARLIDQAPHTVLHGDAHPGNTFVRDGRVGLLDWQAVRRGHPTRDLAYTLVTGMTTADRTANERDLLDRYRHALSRAGGPEIGQEELWFRYRQAAAYAYVAALITAGLGGMQDETIALTGLGRTVAALEDLGTVTALRKGLLANGISVRHQSPQDA
ncbi:aminoglycoside phosphotransferase family protein [Aldersonia sp. NBC_00410]|uniref:phosphotransferase family protein n=1 Tax=Aldersonia sp. NBC_00410 TaxID=2975954 RepID=UPI00224CAFCE|nr:aminoglycoside phosphotransferase family protein [Aldersonia sp. NBC_00410]MCX5044875.1 aminoglycoside phosphotransferase family protein [Aldersonia sp. NBC_00410]